MNPDSWEEDWNGDEGTVAITKSPDDRGDHGGHPRVDIQSVPVKKAVVGAAHSSGSDSDTASVTEPKSDTD